MSQKRRRDTARLLRDGAVLDRAIVAAHRRVVLEHRRLGLPLVIWRDGRVVEVSAESVEIPEALDAHDTSDRES